MSLINHAKKNKTTPSWSWFFFSTVFTFLARSVFFFGHTWTDCIGVGESTKTRSFCRTLRGRLLPSTDPNRVSGYSGNRAGRDTRRRGLLAADNAASVDGRRRPRWNEKSWWSRPVLFRFFSFYFIISSTSVLSPGRLHSSRRAARPPGRFACRHTATHAFRPSRDNIMHSISVYIIYINARTHECIHHIV